MIEVSAASIDRGGQRVLESLTLVLRAGETVGLVGPDGAGKTSLLDAICGIVPLSGGAITLHGVPIKGMPAWEVAARGVARTHQVPRLFARMSVRENVEIAALARGASAAAARAAAPAALAVAGYDGSPRALPRDLTECERRRVELARAIAGAPHALLLDEALACFDAAERAALGAVLAAFARERGTAVLLAERDLVDVAAACDRAVVLHAGKTIAQGAAQALALDPDVRDAYLGVDWQQ